MTKKQPPTPETPRTTEPTGTSRRRFLQVVGIGLVAPSFLKLSACDSDAGTKSKPVTEDVAFFPQGVASGDPRPESVVFWARVRDAATTGDLDVTLLVDTADDFGSPLIEQELVASADHDHIVKVKVSGLDPATVYFYRFVYEKGGERLGSRVARTKTAPAADADVEVKIALASCQDYIGRYFNSYAKMLEQADDLDVVVHIGDYIYETTGDPSFQSAGGERKVDFSDKTGAIAIKNDAGEVSYYAAQSLSNYRELYQTYRSDKWLQRVHERVPFVFIWDDHEFSDDCWGDTATYFDGRANEDHQTSRRENAERANFEYLPTEHGLGAAGDSFDIGTKLPVSDANVVIYRDFKFGKHVHLILTDTRSYRPDHAIPEEVHFARVALTEAELVATGLDPAALYPGGSRFYIPYIDLDAAANADVKARVAAALVDVYAVELPDDSEAALRARSEAQAVGLWSAIEVNKLLAPAITAGDVVAFDVSAETTLPYGATYDHLRFSFGRLFAAGGLHARYLVDKVHFDALMKARLARDPNSQSVFGAKQEAWLKQTLQASTATWKVLATSISMTSMIVDARIMPPALENKPDSDLVRSGLQVFKGLLPGAYYLNADQWDGFPAKRDEMLDLLRGLPNCLLLAGDIHSFYATSHGKGDGAHGVVELTGGGISSESFKGFVRGVVDGLVPGISASPNVAAVISHLEELLQAPYPPLLYANNDAHGFVGVGFTPTQANATMYIAPIAHVTVDAGDDAAAAAAPFEALKFLVKDGVLTKV